MLALDVRNRKKVPLWNRFRGISLALDRQEPLPPGSNHSAARLSIGETARRLTEVVLSLNSKNRRRVHVGRPGCLIFTMNDLQASGRNGVWLFPANCSRSIEWMQCKMIS